jgi:cyclopropane fatty-acyl-phospholipid synthase-like methyltransferase
MSSTERAYFLDMYAASDDPWHFATSAYEQRKYGLTIAALPKERYLNAFEPGCSIGVLSDLLATRCDRLLATDITPEALRQATTRLKKWSNVDVEEMAIPDSWPEGSFDLIVLSEVAYYFDEETLRKVIEHVVRSSVIGAHVLGVHWRGATDYPLSGDRTHELINEEPMLRLVAHYEEDAFIMDLWEREA